MRQTIGASMIVKNETDHLRTALSSLEGIDEIVICDTGSEDDTVAIAKEFTENVFTDYTWNDNFAEARNHVLKKNKADWIFIIDADETLEEGGIEKIRKVIENATPDQYMFSIKMKNSGHVHNSPRIFRNDGRTMWQGAIHNSLTNPQENLTDISMEYGYSTAHKKDPDRAFRILKKEVLDRKNTTARNYYYLAREYWYRKDYENAVFYFYKCTMTSRWAPEIADAYLYLARSLFNISKGDKARDACMKAIQVNPDFKEALLFMAELHYEPFKSRWLEIASTAKNTNVLFKRVQ